ncbi:hypothetical protein J2S43_006344 [Catenuloplanes nepalensis]|uniref:Transposase n=1 Tax=Catenuloplanes nepalensis TaxID=587533 RepID=A0ABT9N2A0_9ACTN|nr:hypothetical protein [Catenuloplanes nepalensis]
MALVRVYCGLASADASARRATEGQSLMVAVVDDAGRQLHVFEISDDAAGFARLSSLLAERSSGSPSVSVAADSDDLLVTSLLTAAGRPLAVADDDDADDFAGRFAGDEAPSSPGARRAVGLARALQAGALTAINVAPPAGLVGYQPVLNAHAALSTGRHAAAVALREVLRELYPAALRAYPDPADPLVLAVLAAVPEPSRLGGGAPGRDREITVATEAIASQIVSDGVAPAERVHAAITALQASVNEATRRGVNRALAPTVAETVRQAVAAVRACDAACETLVATLASRIVAPQPAADRRLIGAPVEPAPAAPTAPPIHPVRGGGAAAAMGSRRARIQASEGQPVPTGPPPFAVAASSDMNGPDTSLSPLSRPDTSSIQLDSTTGAFRRVDPTAGRRAAREAIEQAPVSPAGRRPDSLANRPVSAPPPPPPGLTPIQPGVRPGPKPPARTPSPADSGEPFRAPLTTAAINNSRAEHRQRLAELTSREPELPVANGINTPPPAGGGLTDIRLGGMPPSRTTPQAPEPGSRAAWPTAQDGVDERAHTGEQPQLRGPAGPEAPTMAETLRVRPPWQSDDLPPEPPVLRLVEPVNARRDEMGLNGDAGYAPPLRLVDPARRSAGADALDSSTPLPVDEGDGDLLIFSATASAWFTGHSNEDPPVEAEEEQNWGRMDSAWQAAEQAARPAVGAETNAGLPKRVPQANLVPGSAVREDRQLRIVRDAQSLAANTTGYFRGWRRGQEIGGFAVGGRPGRESAGGWDFTRDQGGRADDTDDDEYEFRSATYHS